MLELREHQQGVINQLRQGFKEGHRSQLLYAPTGFGKTEVAIWLMNATALKGKRSAMIMDRIVLVDQTSARLDKYGIPHGVSQSDHWKYNTTEKIQICSAQTLESRNDFPKVDLLIIDECHIARKQITELIKNNPKLKVIGLTATPFTKGLGNIYSNVVCGSTTEYLVINKWLAPLKIYICKEIDMKGSKKVAGEWSMEEVTNRGMKITGDIVQEWITKTHEIFGRPRKTIVFCAGVAHGQDLVSQFAEKGYNFVSISYKDDSNFKRAIIEDFNKPDTTIHGLIATDILTRGFDVPDVMIGVSARPFAKSLSSHVQQMGRVMRPFKDKVFGLWLDHSGNFLRFRQDWDRVYRDGVKELNQEEVEHTKREPSEMVKKESVCPSCKALWIPKADKCNECGYVKQKGMFSSVAGEMHELKSMNHHDEVTLQEFFSELLSIANDKHYHSNWVFHKFKDKFGFYPNNFKHVPKAPTTKTLNWIKHKMIAYSRANKNHRRAA
jgi:superfamily II DNA or RNA helicase